MGKSILMSIQPRWVAEILNGNKTIEVRKKFPKDYVGWVYIYCTKDQGYNGENQIVRNIKTKEYSIWGDLESYNANDIRSGYNGLVLARFWCDKVSVVERYCGTFIPIDGYTTFLDKRYSYQGLKEATCLNDEEIFKYLGHKNGYAIHISKLEVFDKPKELKEFKHWVEVWVYCGMDCPPYVDDELRPVYTAPQSWCYIYDKGQYV